MFNATFSNFQLYHGNQFLVVEEPGENHRTGRLWIDVYCTRPSMVYDILLNKLHECKLDYSMRKWQAVALSCTDELPWLLVLHIKLFVAVYDSFTITFLYN